MKKKHAEAFIFPLLILLFAVVIFVPELLSKHDEIPQEKPINHTETPNTAGDHSIRTNDYSIAGYGSISLKSGSRDAVFKLTNPEENEGLFSLQCGYFIMRISG